MVQPAAHPDTGQAPHSGGHLATHPLSSQARGTIIIKINILGVVLVCANWKCVHKTISSPDMCDRHTRHAPHMQYALSGSREKWPLLISHPPSDTSFTELYLFPVFSCTYPHATMLKFSVCANQFNSIQLSIYAIIQGLHKRHSLQTCSPQQTYIQIQQSTEITTIQYSNKLQVQNKVYWTKKGI